MRRPTKLQMEFLPYSEIGVIQTLVDEAQSTGEYKGALLPVIRSADTYNIETRCSIKYALSWREVTWHFSLILENIQWRWICKY